MARRPLPLLSMIRRPGGHVGPDMTATLRRTTEVTLGSDGAIVLLDPVRDRDAEIAFGCARSGHCCTGRHLGVANLMLPSEVAACYDALRAAGDVAIGTDLSEFLARLFSAPVRAGGKEYSMGVGRHSAERPMGTFMGLVFRMIPDANPALDGDRCVFLQGDRPGGFACRFHRTAAQPFPCALAPVGPLLTSRAPDDPSLPLLALPETRQHWCTGVQEVLAGSRPWIRLGALLDANDGERRLREAVIMNDAWQASRGWRDGFRDHHSPLALLFIAACPDLERWLVGC
jgi:hypothetical protein